MKRDRGRQLITGAALVLALAVLLFPPWNARAIRMTTRYAAMPGVAPATVVDTVAWVLRASPLFAPPHAVLPASEMYRLATRAIAGDTSAKRRLLLITEPFERRVGAPEILRTSGELWRDSVLAAAGVPSVSAYDVTFAVDDVGIALRLAAVAIAAVVLDRRRPAARVSSWSRARDHNAAPDRS